MAIAKDLMSEDDYLLQKILSNTRTPVQVENIRRELKEILEIITNKDTFSIKLKQPIKRLKTHYFQCGLSLYYFVLFSPREYAIRS